MGRRGRPAARRARRARAPSPGRPATAGAARGRPSPMPASCSATSTRSTSSAARWPSRPSCARRAIERDVCRPARARPARRRLRDPRPRGRADGHARSRASLCSRASTPRPAVMIGGGGGAGLYSVGDRPPARHPACRRPGRGRRALGGRRPVSDLQATFARTAVISTATFDAEQRQRAILGELRARSATRFVARAGRRRAVPRESSSRSRPAIPTRSGRSRCRSARESLANAGRRRAAASRTSTPSTTSSSPSRDDDSPVEIVTWRAHVRCAPARRRRRSVAEAAASARRSGGSAAPTSRGSASSTSRFSTSTSSTDGDRHGRPADRRVAGHDRRGRPGARALRAASRPSSVALAASSRARPIATATSTVARARAPAATASRGSSRAMMNTLLRTARSAILNTARDFSCCILTADDEMLAMAESLPIHVMSGPGPDRPLHEGDAPDASARRRLPAQLAVPRQLARRRLVRRSSPSSTTRRPSLHGPRQGASGRLRQRRSDDLRRRRERRLQRGRADLPLRQGAGGLPRPRGRPADGAGPDPGAGLWHGDFLALLGAARIGERRLLELIGEVGGGRARALTSATGSTTASSG